MWFGVSHRIISRQRSLFNRTELSPCDEISRDLRSGDSFSSPLIENSQVMGLRPKMSQSNFLELFP